MAKTFYLKLVGAQTYGSAIVGTVKKGQTIALEDQKLAEQLLDKGDFYEDGSHRPLFKQVSKEEAYTGSAGQKLGKGRRATLNPALAEEQPVAARAPIVREDNSFIDDSDPEQTFHGSEEEISNDTEERSDTTDGDGISDKAKAEVEARKAREGDDEKDAKAPVVQRKPRTK